MLLHLLISAAVSATLQVGPGTPYATVQSGVDAAASGDVVHLRPGVYRETVVLKSGVTLQGDSPELARIEAPRKLSVLTLRDVDHVVVRALTLAHQAGDQPCAGPVIEIQNSTDVAIHANHVLGSGVTGVSLHNAHAVTVRGNHIYEHTSRGLYAVRSSAEFTDNVLWDNAAGASLLHGAYTVIHEHLRGGPEAGAVGGRRPGLSGQPGRGGPAPEAGRGRARDHQHDHGR